MYRFLDQSRAVLLKLQPAWQLWLSEKLPNLDHQSTYLSGIELSKLGSGSITIGVNNASTASLIKHQKVSALKALNTALADIHNAEMGNAIRKQSTSKQATSKQSTATDQKITKLIIRVDLESTSVAENMHRQATKQKADADDSDVARETPNARSIESIQRLQKTIKNPELADSLGHLAETLKKMS